VENYRFIRRSRDETQKSILFAKNLETTIIELLDAGLSKNSIAKELTRKGIKTVSGCSRWRPIQVTRVIERLNK
jgi:hypothetical protein